MASSPELRVKSDYDRYFEELVDRWIESKRKSGEAFNHTAIVVTAGPYRSAAVSYHSKDGVLHLDFYSALRAGFGSLSAQDVREIKALL